MPGSAFHFFPRLERKIGVTGRGSPHVVKKIKEQQPIELNDVATLEKKVNDARALTVNESHKNKLKRRIQSMAGHYRKRKQLCCSFLSSLEEISDGAISKKKCLKGDGQIVLDSDETVNKAAIAYAKSKKRSKTKSGSLADENFVGVALDSQKMIKRVYVNED